jgi:pimeloyl-ACP methyl ester carboxylesterase
MTATWVLLRGLTREAAHWGSFVTEFDAVEPATRVLALDLPGAGALHRMASPLRVQGLVQHCREQLHARGGAADGPVRLLGLSLGGMVAACWALACPQEVSHLVVVNTSMRPFGRAHERLRPASWPALLPLLIERDARAAEQRILQLTSHCADAQAEVLDEWVAIRRARPVSHANALRQLLAAARYRLPAQVPAARALVLCSAADRLVDPVCSHRLAAHWGCELALHAQAGHDLPLDAGAWVAQRVRQWLAG